MGQAISRKYHSRLRDERAASTRAAILASARRLFAAHGYAQTTLAELAEDAGVSTQTIYNSVGGKQEVLLAVVAMVDEISEVDDVLDRMEGSDDPVEIVEIVVGMRRSAIEGASDILQVFLAAAAAEPAIAEAQRARARRSQERCRRVAARLHAVGGLREGLGVDEASDALYALLHHALWRRLTTECGWELSRVEAWLVDVLRRTLSSTPR